MKFSDIEKLCTEATIETYGKDVKYERLHYCTAWYYDTENFLILRSYRTIIAIYDKRDNKLYDFLRAVYGYTSTSGHHIAKFRNDIRYQNNGLAPEYIRIDE